VLVPVIYLVEWGPAPSSVGTFGPSLRPLFFIVASKSSCLAGCLVFGRGVVLRPLQGPTGLGAEAYVLRRVGTFDLPGPYRAAGGVILALPLSPRRPPVNIVIALICLLKVL